MTNQPPPPAKFGSFRYTFEQRNKERLLSTLSRGAADDWGLRQSLLDGAPRTERRGCLAAVGGAFAGAWRFLKDMVITGWEFGKSDPRKAVFAAKAGLALGIISLLIFLREPFKDLASHCVWAILTVVVVFEFSIGATLSKGFNRGLGTLTAGGLALGVAEFCTLTGPLEEVFIIISIFIVGFFASFIKLYPTMKPYEYGFRVFLLTFCFIMVSGYKTREFTQTAVSRFLLIALGAVVGLGVNVGIYPIWAGEDLHNLVAKNFFGVAKSLEGCVNGYLQCMEYERIPSKILTYQASDDPLYSGYRSAVESTSQEDALLSFAIWEPPHGPYRMLNYPWRNYVRLGGALRHCAFMIMALHGCILSEIQAPPESRQIFSDELRKVGIEGAKVLRELGNKVKTMTKLNMDNFLFDVHEAAEELQKKIDRKSYLLVNTESWEIRKTPEGTKGNLDGGNMGEEDNKVLGPKLDSQLSFGLGTPQLSRNTTFQNPATSEADMGQKMSLQWPSRQSFFAEAIFNEADSKTYESASALSLATFASLLIEFVARLQNVVDAFVELSEKADFKEPVQEPKGETPGLWSRLSKCFGLRN